MSGDGGGGRSDRERAGGMGRRNHIDGDGSAVADHRRPTGRVPRGGGAVGEKFLPRGLLRASVALVRQLFVLLARVAAAGWCRVFYSPL